MFEIVFLNILSIYLYIYQNLKFHIPKTLSHPSTLNSKSRLVNTRDINVFLPFIKSDDKNDQCKHEKWYYECSICGNFPNTNVVFSAISKKKTFISIILTNLNVVLRFREIATNTTFIVSLFIFTLITFTITFNLINI